jgi:hypothetical protein
VTTQPLAYQMQEWAQKDGARSWVPMEDGAAAARWKPRRDPRAAVALAAGWTGAYYLGGGIPAMQVVELPTGTVIWRDSARYPDAGEPIEPAWQHEVYAAERAHQNPQPNDQLTLF